MATPTERRRAALDTNAKLRFERRFRPKVRKAQDDTVRAVTRAFNTTGRLPDVAAIEAAHFRDILREHYEEVGDVFNHRVGDQLPEDVKPRADEVAVVAALLAEIFDERAPLQAERIGGVTARNAKKAEEVAKREKSRIEREEPGRIVSRLEVAATIGGLLSRSQTRRRTGITSYETQVPAELAKNQEARVLLGDETPATQPAEETPAAHEWVTQGDDKVRVKPVGGHLAADSQRVKIGDPFHVGGEELLYPGDRSLGATAANVMNCRCSAVASVDEITNERRLQAEQEGRDRQDRERVARGKLPNRHVVPPPPDQQTFDTGPVGRRPFSTDAPGDDVIDLGRSPNFDADNSFDKWTGSGGEFLPGRRQLHDEIVREFLDGAEAKSKPTLHMVGGGTAAGKGTTLSSGRVMLPTKAVTIDADEVKFKLPEMKAAIRHKDPTGAAFVHEESSVVGKRITRESLENGFDTIIDGTGNGSVEKLRAKVEPFRAAGYRVKADYVTVPTDVAVERARLRGIRTGRVVPESFTREIHAGVSRTFPEAVEAGLFDEVNLYDTNVPKGGKPKLIFSHKDGETTIHNDELWRAFLAKADE